MRKRGTHLGPGHGKMSCWSWVILLPFSVEIASVRLGAVMLKSLPTSLVSFTYLSTTLTDGNRLSDENSKLRALKLIGARRWSRIDDQRNCAPHDPPQPAAKSRPGPA